jgi:hypothetical protein
MEKPETDDFYNDGFGWICKHCERELANQMTRAAESISRLLDEGEAESKNPPLSTPALARWVDPAQRFLMCPRCGIVGPVDKL